MVTDAGGEADGEKKEDCSGAVWPGGLLQTCPLWRGQLVTLLLFPHDLQIYLSIVALLMNDVINCCFQRLGQSGHVTVTCRPFRRQRQRSSLPAAEGNDSCSTTAGSCPEFTPEDRGWTHPTMTRCPCGFVARSWSRLIFRPQVSVQVYACVFLKRNQITQRLRFYNRLRENGSLISGYSFLPWT